MNADGFDFLQPRWGCENDLADDPRVAAELRGNPGLCSGNRVAVENQIAGEYLTCNLHQSQYRISST
jgi:hypothetical protein